MPQTPNQDITGIANYAGSYSQALIGQLLNSLEITSQIKVIYNLTAPLNLTKLFVNGGIRPLDTAVNKAQKPGRKWSKRTLTPRLGMKIFEIIPEELRTTWQSEQLSPNAIDVPFAAWVWGQEFAALQAEINDNLAYSEYHGDAADFDATVVYNPGDVFVFGDNRDIYKTITLTTAGQTPITNAAKFKIINAVAIVDGPLTLLKNMIASGDLPAGQVIATNVIDATNADVELGKVWLASPIALRKKNTKMYISFDVFNDYKRAYDARYGKPHGNILYMEDQETVYLYGTSGKCELVPCTWMGSSQRVIHTLFDNFLMGTNLLDDVNGLGKMIPTLHGFIAICKFILTFQFADTEVIYTNDKL